VAIAGAVFAVAVHTVVPRWGRALQDALAAVKLFVLFFIICCGFAALNGKLRIPKPDNFTNAFEGTSNNGYNIGTGLLNVIFSFNGYDNVNAVSTPPIHSSQPSLTSTLTITRFCPKFAIRKELSELRFQWLWA
jgi:amino acid transporter